MNFRTIHHRTPWLASLFVLALSWKTLGVNGFSARLHRPWDLSAIESRQVSKAVEIHRFYMNRETRAPEPSKTSTSTTSTTLSAVPNNSDSSGLPKDEEEEGEASSSLSPARLFLDSSSERTDGFDSGQINLSNRVNGAAYEKAPTVLTSLRPLFQLTRPANFPGVIFLHLLGSYLTLSHSGQSHLFQRTLFQTPSMWVVLAALLLTSSTSMVVNDYYDKKLGRDTDRTDSPLVSGTLTLAVVRHFLNYLYAAALLCVALVPGIPARISVVIGLMLTFWYTKHMKPLTWLKTLVCSSLISFSPFTSGAAALKVASEIGHGPWGSLSVLAVPSLWRLIAMIFFGVSGREIMMDILDTKDDKLGGVRTIPVKYGRKFASGVAMICYLLAGMWVLGGPLLQIAGQIGESATIVPALKSILLANTDGISRRLMFACLGSLALIGRGVQVFKAEGEDESLINRTVNEAQLVMVLSMLSFI